MQDFKDQLSLFMFKIGAVSLIVGIFSSLLLPGTPIYMDSSALAMFGFGLTAFFWIVGFILHMGQGIPSTKTETTNS